jgi:hypothetical protein
MVSVKLQRTPEAQEKITLANTHQIQRTDLSQTASHSPDHKPRPCIQDSGTPKTRVPSCHQCLGPEELSGNRSGAPSNPVPLSLTAHPWPASGPARAFESLLPGPGPTLGTQTAGDGAHPESTLHTQPHCTSKVVSLVHTQGPSSVNPKITGECPTVRDFGNLIWWTLHL